MLGSVFLSVNITVIQITVIFTKKKKKKDLDSMLQISAFKDQSKFCRNYVVFFYILVKQKTRTVLQFFFFTHITTNEVCLSIHYNIKMIVTEIIFYIKVNFTMSERKEMPNLLVKYINSLFISLSSNRGKFCSWKPNL